MAKPKKIELIEVTHLDSWLGSTGYLFPSNEIEMDRFNNLYDDYEFKLDDRFIDPIAIINNTFHREPRIISMFENNVDDEIESLKMVARKGKSELSQHTIDKMLKNHDRSKNDS